MMIETFLFLLQIESSFKLPQRRLPFPLRVEGLRHHRQRTHEPIRVSNVSGLLSEVRIDQSDPNILVLHVKINERKHAVDAMLLCLHFLLLST
jgi:hypothetical protein